MTNDPDYVVREYINNYFDSSKTDPYPKADYGLINPAWYEKIRQERRQIFFATYDNNYRSLTEHIQLEMDITKSPVLSQSIRYVYISAPTKALRDEMKLEMFSIFDATVLIEGLSRCINFTAGDGTVVNMIRIVRDHPIDKDKRYEQTCWMQVFEIHIHW